MLFWHSCADGPATRPWEGPWGPRAAVAGTEQGLPQLCCVGGQGTEQHGLVLRSGEGRGDRGAAEGGAAAGPSEGTRARCGVRWRAS